MREMRRVIDSCATKPTKLSSRTEEISTDRAQHGFRRCTPARRSIAQLILPSPLWKESHDAGRTNRRIKWATRKPARCQEQGGGMNYACNSCGAGSDLR